MVGADDFGGGGAVGPAAKVGLTAETDGAIEADGTVVVQAALTATVSAIAVSNPALGLTRRRYRSRMASCKC